MQFSNGSPYTLQEFFIDAANYKIGRLLAHDEKRGLETRFKVHFTVQRVDPKSSSQKRKVVLTAWNANHDDVGDALDRCQEYILSRIA
jgi:hypothetical protein